MESSKKIEYDTLLHLVNNSQTYTGILMLDGTVIYANTTSLKLENLQHQDVAGKKFWDCKWWNNDLNVQVLIKAACIVAASGAPTCREILYINEKVSKWVEIKATPVLNNEEKVEYIVVEGQSIDERKQAEHNLNKVKQEYKQFINKLAVPFILYGEDNYVEYNMSAVKMLGYSKKEELLGKSPLELSPSLQPNGQNSIEIASRMVAKSHEKGLHCFEWTLVKKNGSLIEVEVIISPVSYSNASLLHILLLDLTEFKQQQKVVRDSELRYRSLFEMSSDGISLLENNRFIDCNNASLKMLGFDNKKDLFNKDPADFSPLVQPDGQNSFEKTKKMMEIVLEKGSHRFEWNHKRKNGDIFPAEVSLAEIFIDGKQLLHVICRDITEIKRQQQASYESERKYRSFFEGSADAIVVLEKNQIVDCNEAATKMFAYTDKNEMKNVHPAELSPPCQPDGENSLEMANKMIAIALDKGSHRFEWDHKRKNGEVFPVDVLIIENFVGKKHFLFAVLRDITEVKKQQQELQHLAHYDSLTRLPNRVLFSKKFEKATEHSKQTQTQLAVCFLDLDNFKPINDEFGHAVGDQLLKQVANRIVECIRNEDTVSRQGGDEFTMLLGSLESSQECEQLLNHILYSLSKPYIINEQVHSITATCGVTIYPKDEGDIDTLVRHADHAMYQAKLLSKNSFAFFDAETEQSSQQRMAFLVRVSEAILAKELVLFYQPKIDMRSGQMFGVEALIRWQSPENNLIAPFDFLPKIENTQVMVDVGKWVIEQALAQLSQWYHAGNNWVVSINIDAYHFMQASFFEDLKQALAKHPNIPAELIEIEILETVAFNDIEAVADLIRQCQTLGVSFALDDFGTGYSSLAYLKRLPVQWLKIDQSFVRDMLEDEENLALIEGIISLAKVFKRKVIAEGVETVEHGTTLLRLGCHHAQGNGITKPMAAEKIVGWAVNYHHEKAWSNYEKQLLS